MLKRSLTFLTTRYGTFVPLVLLIVFVAAWLNGASVVLATWAMVAKMVKNMSLFGSRGARWSNGGFGFGGDGDNVGHGKRMGSL